MVSDPPARQPAHLPLSQLRKGERAVMSSADLSPEDRAMLCAMGLDEHKEFTVCRAGGGGPCIIRLDATRLGLSPELAAKILTRPCDCPSATECRAPEPPSSHERPAQ